VRNYTWVLTKKTQEELARLGKVSTSLPPKTEKGVSKWGGGENGSSKKTTPEIGFKEENAQTNLKTYGKKTNGRS